MTNSYANPQYLVSTEWLAANLSQPDLRVVDATYYLPMQNKNARAEYDERHIPGAYIIELNQIKKNQNYIIGCGIRIFVGCIYYRRLSLCLLIF